MTESKRGSVMVLVLAILFVLASLALVMARSMRVEAMAAANHTAQLEARAAAQGAVAYLRVVLADRGGRLPGDEEVEAEAVRVGNGFFWLIKPEFEDDRRQGFGLIDEAGKVNLNSASLDMLMRLPSMSADLAAGIIDWRDEDEAATAGGAESAWYQMNRPPYRAKNDRLETVEELLLVKDFTQAMLYGEDVNRNHRLDANEDDGEVREPADNRDGKLERGLFPWVTVYSVERVRVGRRMRMVEGRINLNSAPWQVLATLPGLNEAEAKAIVAYRLTQGEFNNVNLLAEVLPTEKVGPVLPLVTISTYRCAADIVAVDGRGRTFVRYYVVLDIASNPVRVIYMRDLTSLGWPMEQRILDELREGRGNRGAVMLGASVVVNSGGNKP